MGREEHEEPVCSCREHIFLTTPVVVLCLIAFACFGVIFFSFVYFVVLLCGDMMLVLWFHIISNSEQHQHSCLQCCHTIGCCKFAIAGITNPMNSSGSVPYPCASQPHTGRLLMAMCHTRRMMCVNGLSVTRRNSQSRMFPRQYQSQSMSRTAMSTSQ